MSLIAADWWGKMAPRITALTTFHYLRCIPNMIVAAPMNEEELQEHDVHSPANKTGPFSIRYPKRNGVMPDWETPFTELEIGKGRKI